MYDILCIIVYSKNIIKCNIIAGLVEVERGRRSGGGGALGGLVPEVRADVGVVPAHGNRRKRWGNPVKGVENAVKGVVNAVKGAESAVKRGAIQRSNAAARGAVSSPRCVPTYEVWHRQYNYPC